MCLLTLATTPQDARRLDNLPQPHPPPFCHLTLQQLSATVHNCPRTPTNPHKPPHPSTPVHNIPQHSPTLHYHSSTAPLTSPPQASHFSPVIIVHNCPHASTIPSLGDNPPSPRHHSSSIPTSQIILHSTNPLQSLTTAPHSPLKVMNLRAVMISLSYSICRVFAAHSVAAFFSSCSVRVSGWVVISNSVNDQLT